MDVKYQIFVSSTYDDLADERRAVMEAILNLRHIPVGMEQFHATDENQWSYIKRRIAQCDYYVVIVAERYGSEFEGKSYTQKEYELAVELKIPVIGFLLANEAKLALPQPKVEFAKKEKVEAFRELCKQKPVKFWKNSDDLALKVTQAINEITVENPQVGWVRADSVPSLKVVEELSRLSQEKRELQLIIDKLSQDESSIRIPPEVVWRIERLDEKTVDDAAMLNPRDEATSLLDVFLDLDHCLATEADIDETGEFFANVIGYHIEEHEIELVMTEFVKHGIVRSGSTGSGGARMKTFGLTESGKQFLMYAQVWKARNRPSPAE